MTKGYGSVLKRKAKRLNELVEKGEDVNLHSILFNGTIIEQKGKLTRKSADIYMVHRRFIQEGFYFDDFNGIKYFSEFFKTKQIPLRRISKIEGNDIYLFGGGAKR